MTPTNLDAAAAPRLLLAHCQRCGAHSYPANSWACRVCGAPADALLPVACAAAPRLCNFVTVFGDLVPGVPPPCVIGEVELADGVIEEALLDVADESGLVLGMALQPVAERDEAGALRRWRFRPASAGGAA